mmetsp:Transcript_21556/g.82033  ORF Transcript_21556/g.82033 Transcript_21556/m.82033 type:complete len:253 (+) Transcript_21556:1105-1863(+)
MASFTTGSMICFTIGMDRALALACSSTSDTPAQPSGSAAVPGRPALWAAAAAATASADEPAAVCRSDSSALLAAPSATMTAVSWDHASASPPQSTAQVSAVSTPWPSPSAAELSPGSLAGGRSVEGPASDAGSIVSETLRTVEALPALAALGAAAWSKQPRKASAAAAAAPAAPAAVLPLPRPPASGGRPVSMGSGSGSTNTSPRGAVPRSERELARMWSSVWCMALTQRSSSGTGAGESAPPLASRNDPQP